MLSASVGLFLASGAFWVAIGLLIPIARDRGSGDRTLIVSPRSDTALFGDAPERLMRNDPSLGKLRAILLDVVGGLLVAAGALELVVAWFGLREREIWSLAALAGVGAGVLPFWWLVRGRYVRAGAPLALFDIPPFMWVPAALLLPGAILGAMSLA